MDTLLQQWLTLGDNLSVLPDVAAVMGRDLWARYGENGRFYHNHNHLHHVLTTIEAICAPDRPAPTLLLAAWYHDAVYVPRAADNEAQSAALARQQLAAHFYDSQGVLLAVSPIWQSNDYEQPATPLTHSGSVSHATATQMRLGLLTVLDEGWLAFDTVKVTSRSQPVLATANQQFDLEALLNGQLDQPGSGRLFIEYSDGTIVDIWESPANFQGSLAFISGSFTLLGDVSSFQVGTEVRLDKGWLTFSNLTLTGWSDTIAVEDGYEYLLGLHIAGDLQAAQGQGGKVMVHYPNSSAEPEVLWQNPANFNSSGTTVSQTFTPPAGATEVQFGYMVTMDKGWLAFSEPQLQWLAPGDTITRKTYALAGKAIATRISGNQEGENGLFYIHSDHLGSTSVMSYGQGHPNPGTKVLDSRAHYLPFGDWRVEPGHELTDQGFTGQKHNMDLGLYYYNARFYLPYINRFISADSIVPNPANPQSFNRYSYVRNNPLKYKDPTGHYECHANGICADVITSTWTPVKPVVSVAQSLISFTGGAWTDAERETVLQGAYMLAQALARTMNDLSGGAYDTIGWETAFFSVFGDKVTFHKTGTDCASDCWGKRVRQNFIEVYNNMGDLSSLVRGSTRITNGELWAVHELGHDFEAQLSRARNNVWGPARTALRQSNVPSGEGFAGVFPGWRQSRSLDFGEQFADSVVGWTYGRWAIDNDGQITGAGQRRQAFMQQQMSLWVSQMTGVGLCGGGCR